MTNTVDSKESKSKFLCSNFPEQYLYSSADQWSHFLSEVLIVLNYWMLKNVGWWADASFSCIPYWDTNPSTFFQSEFIYQSYFVEALILKGTGNVQQVIVWSFLFFKSSILCKMFFLSCALALEMFIFLHNCLDKTALKNWPFMMKMTDQTAAVCFKLPHCVKPTPLRFTVNSKP